MLLAMLFATSWHVIYGNISYKHLTSHAGPLSPSGVQTPCYTLYAYESKIVICTQSRGVQRWQVHELLVGVRRVLNGLF